MNVNDMMDIVGSPAVASKGDYIHDGLLYCGKCHTPKQTRISIDGKVWTPSCMCECESARFKEKMERMDREAALEAVKRLRSMGFTETRLKEMTFDRDDDPEGKLSQICRKYVNIFAQMQIRGKGLLLYGHVGTGKTFYASCIANALIEKGHPCLLTNFATLVNTMSCSYDKQRYIEDLKRFDLLVIDDLAAERETSYMSEIVQNVIDARYRSGKPLIVTTNLTPAELKNPDDIRKARIYSRLFEMCIPVEASGSDRRRDALKRNYAEFKEKIGL